MGEQAGLFHWHKLHVFSLHKIPNNDSPRTLNNKKQKAMPWSHIKASCWVVNVWETSGFLPLREQHVRLVPQESLQMRRVQYKPQTQWGGRRLTWERAEGVGCDLGTERIQSHRFGQGLLLGLRQRRRLWRAFRITLRVRRANLQNGLLRTQQDTWIWKLECKM